MKKVGLVGWRGMAGSVLMGRMLEEKDFLRPRKRDKKPRILLVTTVFLKMLEALLSLEIWTSLSPAKGDLIPTRFTLSLENQDGKVIGLTPLLPFE